MEIEQLGRSGVCVCVCVCVCFLDQNYVIKLLKKVQDGCGCFWVVGSWVAFRLNDCWLFVFKLVFFEENEVGDRSRFKWLGGRMEGGGGTEKKNIVSFYPLPVRVSSHVRLCSLGWLRWRLAIRSLKFKEPTSLHTLSSFLYLHPP